MFGHFQWKSWTEHNINVHALLIHRSGRRGGKRRYINGFNKERRRCFSMPLFRSNWAECNNKKLLINKLRYHHREYPHLQWNRKKRNGFPFQNPPLCEHTITSIEWLSLLEMWWISSIVQNLLNCEGVAFYHFYCGLRKFWSVSLSLFYPFRTLFGLIKNLYVEWIDFWLIAFCK